MPINPVEDLNTFSEALQDELSKRSRSKELVRTRAPFLRFTTGANMSDLAGEKKNFTPITDYEGCQFFSLGLHGWNNLNYSTADVYGSKADKGLLVGVTYKGNESKLVYAKATNIANQTYKIPSNNTTVGVPGAESNKGYPPPGITSVTIDRVRAGNVLKFKIEASCYTQQQLEMLDKVCFVPGMTCVLEWGTVHSTPTGIKSPEKILKFTDSNIIRTLQTDESGTRSEHVKNWCLPNNFKYDFAIAKIANIQTTVQDGVYKVTVTAVGKADNILYISAYATNTPQNNLSPSNTEEVSISQYFKPDGRFTKILNDIIARPVEDSLAKGILRFADPDDVKAINKIIAAATETGGVNDLGFEDTFYIRFDIFVAYFLNDATNGIIKIINSGMKISEQLPRVLSNLNDGADGITGKPVIQIGYHKDLRSTQPSVMIINNIDKRNVANSVDVEIRSKATTQLGKIKNAETRLNESTAGSASTTGGVDQVFDKLTASPFASIDSEQLDSGVAAMGRGIFINSKAIQAAFINARTWAEGLELLLRNINGATEGYWDLKLFFDDEDKSFRILDDNLRKVSGFNQNKHIYTFNKKLVAADNDVIGPDVLDIDVKTDYPKLVFSQLAMSAIGGSVSDPNRKELDFLRGNVVSDMLFPPSEITPTNTEKAATDDASLTISAQNITELKKTFNLTFKEVDTSTFGPGGVFPNGISSALQSMLSTLFRNTSLLTKIEADNYIRQLLSMKPPLTQEQLVALQQILAERTKAIITKLKNEEIERITAAYRTRFPVGDMRSGGDPTIAASSPGSAPLDRVIEKIKKNKNDLINEITEMIPRRAIVKPGDAESGTTRTGAPKGSPGANLPAGGQ